MRRIDYFKVFAFLVFIGSMFLSTIFHYPLFTIFWFGAMILFVCGLTMESSELTILVFTALAYIPLGLIAILSDALSKTNPPYYLSQFAWVLLVFTVIEFIFAFIWINSGYLNEN